MSGHIEVIAHGALVHFLDIAPNPAGRTDRRLICQMTPEQADALADSIRDVAKTARAHRVAIKQRRIDDLKREIERLTAERDALESGAPAEPVAAGEG